MAYDLWGLFCRITQMAGVSATVQLFQNVNKNNWRKICECDVRRKDFALRINIKTIGNHTEH